MSLHVHICSVCGKKIISNIPGTSFTCTDCLSQIYKPKPKTK